MSNQDLEGKAQPGAPAGKPESPEQLLAKEREARALMRDRLRNTESLAAESHALRERMAQELERVTAERDRLRSAAAAASTATPSPTPSTAARPTAPIEPTLSSTDAARMARAFDPPPQPPSRGGPWRALAMLGGLAVGIAALAWITGSLPGEGELAASSSTAAPAPIVTAARRTPVPAASIAVEKTAPAASVAAVPPSNGAVALAPVTPEAQLAAAPTAAGTSTATSGLEARLRAALDGEGIASPVDIDAATGHVAVADPQADATLRDRTDLVIRAVYAGANLPEPRIEHRWLSPMRGGHVVAASAAASAPPVAAYAVRHVPMRGVAEQRQKPAEAVVADAQEPRPILPEGRVTAACKSDLAGKSTAHHGAALMACMKHSCCSAGNRQTEECRAYDKAYPFTCSAG